MQGFDWNIYEKEVPDGPGFAEFGYGHAIAIMFFYDRRLREAFPTFWDRIDKGWKYTFHRPITVDQLNYPPAYGKIARNVAWCRKAINLLQATVSSIFLCSKLSKAVHLIFSFTSDNNIVQAGILCRQRQYP